MKALNEGAKPRWRIKRYGVNSYELQRRVLWFWLNQTEWGFYSEQDARDCLAKWEADWAVSGQVIEL